MAKLTQAVRTLTVRGTRLFGVGLAGTGAAHFVAPQVFEPVSKIAFPEDTRRWIYRNGATEVALGLALSHNRKSSRNLGRVGLLAYVGWLASRAAANR